MEVKVPSVGESVTEVTIAQWLTGVGTWVEVDQPLVSVESDKADMEISIAGTIREVLKCRRRRCRCWRDHRDYRT